MYEVGKVYIWQNQTGIYEFKNGLECTVIGPKVLGRDRDSNEILWVQETDMPSIDYPGKFVHAAAGDLRPKNPPSGERLVRDLFEPKPVMEVA